MKWPTRSDILAPDGRVKIQRYYLVGRGNTFGLFLHRFAGSDSPTVLHDHPWAWAFSLVLAGGYREHRRRTDGTTFSRWLRPGRLVVIRPTDFHCVELRDGRAAWTLFLHGPKVRRWGFLDLVTGEFRYWRRDVDGS